MSCVQKFSFPEEIHRQNRRATLSMVEHGGNTIINFDKKTLLLGERSEGKYASISMPRGVVDWHSHPRKCKDRQTCALGLPSPADMCNVLIGAVYGSQAHLVYAAEGTYVITVQPSLLHHARESNQNLKNFCRKIRTSLEKLHESFLKRQDEYETYRDQWFPVSKQLGFDVDFFKKDTLPRISLHTKCGTKGSFFAPVFVPKTVQSEVLRAQKVKKKTKCQLKIKKSKKRKRK